MNTRSLNARSPRRRRLPGSLHGLLGGLLLVTSLLVIAPALYAGGAAEASAQTAGGATITVVGHGELFAEPDQATITVGVQLYNESAQEASAELRERMDAVVTAIKSLGVLECNIQTTNYSIFFERDYQTPLATRNEEGRPVGIYRVENMVRVTVADISRAVAVVEAAIEAGANQLYGINFSFSDPDELDARARALAMENARSRAEELAGAAGRSVGAALEITELVAGNPVPLEPQAMASGMGGGPVQPGATQYTTRIQVTYELE
jgi:uncharacterized protein